MAEKDKIKIVEENKKTDEKRSHTTIKDGVFTKTLIQDDGTVKTWKHKRAKWTVNDEETKNKKEVLKRWAEEADLVVTKSFKSSLKVGTWLRYVAKTKDTEKWPDGVVLRIGGVITKLEDDYLCLANINADLRWSVQYKDLVKVFQTGRKKGQKQTELTVEQFQIKKKIEKEQAKEEKLKERDEAKEKKKREKERERNQLKRERKEKKAEERREQRELKKAEKERALAEQKKKEADADPAEDVLKEYYYEKGYVFGRDKLFKTLQADGHKISRATVDKWLKKQKLYQLDKPQFNTKDFNVQTASEPNKVWNIDLVMVDDKVILNAVDRFSKFAYSRILKNKTAKQVVVGLKSMFEKAKPSGLVSDNGPEFASIVTKEYLKDEGIKQFFSSPHNPASNGLVERFNRTMKDAFKKMSYIDADEKLTLTQATLTKLVKTYNNSYHSGIEMKPADALKEENWEKVDKLNEKRLVTNITEDKNDLGKGDQVRISLDKGNNKGTKDYRTTWSEDLYFIKAVKRPRNKMRVIQYQVEDAQGDAKKGFYKRNELQKVTAVENENLVAVPYSIERFVKKSGDDIEVSYKGYRAEDNLWIPKDDLKKDLGKEVYNKLYREAFK